MASDRATPVKKMSSTLSALYRKGTSFLTPNASNDSLARANGFATAAEGKLFTKVDPAIDGPDCDQDCASCTIHYPAKFSIDEDDKLYGHVKGWSTHLLVATGKTDWVRDVEDEKGSVMEAVGKSGVKPSNGRLMLSAANIPTPDCDESTPLSDRRTIVFLLPAFTIVEDVTPATTPDLLAHVVSTAPTNTSLLNPENSRHDSTSVNGSAVGRTDSHAAVPPVTAASTATSSSASAPEPPLTGAVALPDFPFRTAPIPHTALILLCSQKTRDARCGQSAPLLRRELERHLRPLGLYRDLHDMRPGGVGIYFISHVGGHKYSANVMVYRREGAFEDKRDLSPDTVEKGDNEERPKEAAQCIWLARVRPQDCEGIVKYTVLQGKVVHPERQLRGGFDRARGLISW